MNEATDKISFVHTASIYVSSSIIRKILAQFHKHKLCEIGPIRCVLFYLRCVLFYASALVATSHSSLHGGHSPTTSKARIGTRKAFILWHFLCITLPSPDTWLALCPCFRPSSALPPAGTGGRCDTVLGMRWSAVHHPLSVVRSLTICHRTSDFTHHRPGDE